MILVLCVIGISDKCFRLAMHVLLLHLTVFWDAGSKGNMGPKKAAMALTIMSVLAFSGDLS